MAGQVGVRTMLVDARAGGGRQTHFQGGGSAAFDFRVTGTVPPTVRRAGRGSGRGGEGRRGRLGDDGRGGGGRRLPGDVGGPYGHGVRAERQVHLRRGRRAVGGGGRLAVDQHLVLRDQRGRGGRRPTDRRPDPDQPPPDWGTSASAARRAGPRRAPTPRNPPEFGGGWFDPWGGAEFDGAGYAGSARTRDAAYERRFYLTNLANGITVHNVYMTFGGTSWGWLPAPQVYTSYDYGAAFDEGRRATPKSSPCTSSAIWCGAYRSWPSWTGLGRHRRATRDQGLPPGQPGHRRPRLRPAQRPARPVTSTLPVAGTSLPVTVPASDARLLAAGIALGRRKLAYSNAQPMLWLTAGGRTSPC